jgi:hypothetical protein
VTRENLEPYNRSIDRLAAAKQETWWNPIFFFCSYSIWKLYGWFFFEFSGACWTRFNSTRSAKGENIQEIQFQVSSYATHQEAPKAGQFYYLFIVN